MGRRGHSRAAAIPELRGVTFTDMAGQERSLSFLYE
jgi:hypothetical protein